jgi:hypothetical protein
MVKLAYSLFVGLLLATLLAVGISAFYPAPKNPEPFVTPAIQKPGLEPTKEEVTRMEKDQRDWQAFNEAQHVYSRNVAIISLVISVSFVVLGLFSNKLPLLTDGLVLGGVFGLVYSIARGFESKDDIFRFIVVAASLGVTLIIGQMRLAKVFQKIK